MIQTSEIKRKRALLGWIKWISLPCILFVFIIFDVFLNIQVQIDDRIMAELNNEFLRLETEFRTESSRLSLARGSIADTIKKAEEMGMVAPDIDQLKTVAYRSVQLNVIEPLEAGFEVAQSSPSITTVKLADDEKDSATSSTQFFDVTVALAQAAKEPQAIEEAAEVTDISIASDEAVLVEELPDISAEDPELQSLGLEEMLASL